MSESGAAQREVVVSYLSAPVVCVRMLRTTTLVCLRLSRWGSVQLQAGTSYYCTLLFPVLIGALYQPYVSRLVGLGFSIIE